jgi:hypothetical protein
MDEEEQKLETTSPQSTNQENSQTSSAEKTLPKQKNLNSVIPPMQATNTLFKVPLKQYTEQENIFLKKESIKKIPVYYFTQTELNKEPDFDKTIIEKLTKTQSFKSMNIYFIENGKVLIEIDDDKFSKWYLLEKLSNGKWTIQKYEKEIFENVVK